MDEIFGYFYVLNVLNQLLENPISALAPPSQKPSPGNSMQLEQLIFNSFVVLDDGLMMIMVISEHNPEKNLIKKKIICLEYFQNLKTKFQRHNFTKGKKSGQSQPGRKGPKEAQGGPKGPKRARRAQVRVQQTT